MTSTSIISNSVSKDALMKNLFKFPKETLLFVKEVARINEDTLLEQFIHRLLSDTSLSYTMYALNEEKISSTDYNRFKRLDLALEFRTDTENLEFIIFIENQTTNDRTMIFRMLEYITATMLEKLGSKNYDVSKGLPRPIPILIYIGAEACHMPVQMEEYFKMPMVSSAGITFKTHLVDLGGKEYQQILENTSTPSIFLQLMKAIYTADDEGFKTQRQALYDNLRVQESEVADYYKGVLGVLAIDFVEYFSGTTGMDKKEVERMATTVREILDIDNIISRAQKEGIEKTIISFLDILDDKTIAERTGISIEEIAKLREQQH